MSPRVLAVPDPPATEPASSAQRIAGAPADALTRTPVIAEDDPLWQAFLNAPVDDGPIPDEEARALEEAQRCDVFVDGAAVSAWIAERVARGG